jgi:iron complex outermembrane receptor protein
MRTCLGLLTTVTTIVSAQNPSAPDTAQTVRLAEIEVSVARGSDSLGTVPHAISLISARTLRVAQPGLGLDEALTTVPGVHVANRWNLSLDQRLSIRGFGSRANFGVRGVKILLDGIPQTLPDGQSQLTNVDFAALQQIEVLRGTSSALHGNASGGVLLLTSAPIARTGAGIRTEVGSFGTTKWLVRGGGRNQRGWAGVTFSRFHTDGFREHSAADLRQGTLSGTYLLSDATSISARFAFADNPRAENPGAITFEQAAADPTSASPNNLARGADKDVSQQQVSIALRHSDAAGWSLRASLFGLWRDLKNPLATPPPGPFSQTAGTFNAIDRVVAGGRVEAAVPLGSPAGRPLGLILGLDVQRMRDDRENLRSENGIPTAEVLARQQEVISELGPFAQVRWVVGPRLNLRAGVRYDRIAFDVEDQLVTDGEDHSGTKVMSEPSASFGATLQAAEDLTLYGSVATSFETPTSTELVTTATGGVGLNAALGPQRATGLELGTRWHTGIITAEGAVFTNRIRRAIVQVREQDGRAFFANAGGLHTTGLEAGLTVSPHAKATFAAAYTWSRARFEEYRLRDGTSVDTLDGKQLAGIPTHFLRLGLSLLPTSGFDVVVDHLMSSALFADDRNTLEVLGWGAGVTNLRMQWSGTNASINLSPFVALMNVFNRTYVGSVTINGFGGRVLEPSPGRYVYIGVDLDWARR